MKNLAAEFLIVLVIAIAAAGFGHQVGKRNADNAWKAKEADRLQAERLEREAEFRRGDKASGELQAQLLRQRITNDELAKAFNAYKRQHPILARRSVGPAPAAGGQAPVATCDQVPPGDSPALSLGAVWMWNSALAGRDVPAGACGLADTSEGACAADSGISLEEAWDNQALNARICAEDRIRHQRLIDYINGKGQ